MFDGLVAVTTQPGSYISIVYSILNFDNYSIRTASSTLIIALDTSTTLQDLWTYHYYSLNAFSDMSPIMCIPYDIPYLVKSCLLLVTVGCSASSNILWQFTLSRCLCTCTWTIAALVNLWPWVSSISDYACYTSWALHSIFLCWHEIEFRSQVIQWCCTSG